MSLKKGIGIFLVLSLLISVSVILLLNQDRTDNRRFLDKIPGTNIYLSSFPLSENTKPKVELQINTGQPDCLNGKDASTLTPKQQLLEFIEGPCSPIILSPGITATRLSVQIDCETLQKENPEIFESCGWDTCSSYDLFGSKPNSEYVLWISDFFSPMSIIFDDTAICFGNLVQLNINASAIDWNERYKSPAGANVTVFGNTPESASQAECGFGAVNDIFPFDFQLEFSQGFQALTTGLVSVGYQTGLSLFVVPYDFRVTSVASGVDYLIERTILYVYQLTGKRVILLAHSLGNFGVLNLLHRWTPEQKATYISSYVAVMPPYNGSPKVIGSLLCGDNEYFYEELGIELGINFYAQKMFIGSSSGFMDGAPRQAYALFADEPWMVDVQNRIMAENTYNVSTPEGMEYWLEAEFNNTVPLSWFPTPLNKCAYGFSNRSDQCLTMLYDMSTTPIAMIMNKSINTSREGMLEMFENYVTLSDNIETLYKDSWTNDANFFDNLQIPVILIYGSHLLNNKTFVFDYMPNTETGDGEWAPPNSTIYGNGDETIPVAASMIAGAKWAWEFDNMKQEIENVNPVKVVEYCSIYNNRDTVYDQMNPNESFKMTKNEYIGLNCSCMTGTDAYRVPGGDCDHSDSIEDAYFVSFIANISMTNESPSLNASQIAAFNLTDQQIANLISSCPNLYADFNVIDPMQLLGFVMA